MQQQRVSCFVCASNVVFIEIVSLLCAGDPGTTLVPYLRIFDVATYVDMMMQVGGTTSLI